MKNVIQISYRNRFNTNPLLTQLSFATDNDAETIGNALRPLLSNVEIHMVGIVTVYEDSELRELWKQQVAADSTELSFEEYRQKAMDNPAFQRMNAPLDVVRANARWAEETGE